MVTARPSRNTSGPRGLVSPVMAVCRSPSMVISAPRIAGSGDASAMVNHPSAGGASGISKLMRHGVPVGHCAFESRMAWRKEPGPSFAGVVTENSR